MLRAMNETVETRRDVRGGLSHYSSSGILWNRTLGDTAVKYCFEYEIKERKGGLSPIYGPAPCYASTKIANDAMIWRTKQAEEIAS